MRHTRMLSFALVLLAAAGPAMAQQGGAVAAPPLPPRQGPPAGARDSIETRLRERMAQVIQRQVGLSDDQMRRLRGTTQRFEGQRRDLLARERQVRLALRDELQAGDSTRQPQVARLLDQMLQIQRQRLEVLEAEQKELATFMTPIQRAKYFGLEEQVRRRMEEMRDQGARQGPGAGMRRPGAALPRGGGLRRPPPGESPAEGGAPPAGAPRG